MKKAFKRIVLLLALSLAVSAQVNAQFAPGQVLSAAQLNAAFATKNLTHTQQEIDKSYTYSTPAAGSTVTIASGSGTAIINPSGTLGTLTVTLPSCTAGYDGSIVRYSSSQTITTITVSSVSSTVANAPSNLSPGVGNAYLCRGSSATWYRLY